MAALQSRVDLAFARAGYCRGDAAVSVTAKEIHERGDCFRIPIRAGFFQSDGVFGKGTKRLNRRRRANRRLAHR